MAVKKPTHKRKVYQKSKFQCDQKQPIDQNAEYAPW
jgi:hypothetical protein